MKIEVQVYEPDDQPEIKRPPMRRLGDAEKQDRPKSEQRFEGTHREAGERRRITKGVVASVKAPKRPRVQKPVLPIEPRVDDDEARERLGDDGADAEAARF